MSAETTDISEEPIDTTISMRKSTRERLRALKDHPTDTWDQVARKLAACYEDHEVEGEGEE